MASAKKVAKGAKNGKGRHAKSDDPVSTLVQELHRQRAEIAHNNELLRSAIDWSTTVQQQLEAVLTAQRRTNSLLELALGSALDAEIDAPRPQA